MSVAAIAACPVADDVASAVEAFHSRLEASSHTVDYLCGNCETVLLHAEAGQVHNRFIKCTKCGSYNATDA